MFQDTLPRSARSARWRDTWWKVAPSSPRGSRTKTREIGGVAVLVGVDVAQLAADDRLEVGQQVAAHEPEVEQVDVDADVGVPVVARVGAGSGQARDVEGGAERRQHAAGGRDVHARERAAQRLRGRRRRAPERRAAERCPQQERAVASGGSVHGRPAHSIMEVSSPRRKPRCMRGAMHPG